MNRRTGFCVLLVSLLFFGLVVNAYAEDPLDKPDSITQQSVSDTPKGGFEPGPIEVASQIFDPSVASVTNLQVVEDDDGDKTLAPAAPGETSKEGLSTDTSLTAFGRFDVTGIEVDLATAGAAAAPQFGNLAAAGNRAVPAGVDPAASSQILFQDFEGAFAPDDPGWHGYSSTSQFWDDVNCYAIENTGDGWSAWPADEGTNGLDPCGGDPYDNNMMSWLVYGPFSLVGAKAATFDFYYRIVSETGYDFLQWMVSVDGNAFHGYQVSGTHTGGPFFNGYNFTSLDLANVPTLGDVTGESQVWIAFIFRSDSSNTAQGPFIDAITLRKNTEGRKTLLFDNFDGSDIPNQDWDSFDQDGTTNGEYSWDDATCYTLSGDNSVWPARAGANGINPCTSGTDYPNNAQSWLVYGPFSLEGASEAWVDFYYRNQTEIGEDWFGWGASKDGDAYYGTLTSGTTTSGPNTNGYNLRRFDLSSVYTLGDLRGESEVWLAFVFFSNATNTAKGPFLDNVNVLVEHPKFNQVYVPDVSVPGAQAPTMTNLYVENATTAAVNAYTVHNTPEGDITCGNIPAQTTRLCGTFTPGTYDVSVSTVECGDASGQVEFVVGPVTRQVRCVTAN